MAETSDDINDKIAKIKEEAMDRFEGNFFNAARVLVHIYKLPKPPLVITTQTTELPEQQGDEATQIKTEIL